MRVMGIDPGSNCTGFGIVEEQAGRLVNIHYGSIQSRSGQPFAERLKAIYSGLTQAIRDYSPDAVAVEDMFFATNVKSALKLGQTRGVTLLAAVNENKPLADCVEDIVKYLVSSGVIPAEKLGKRTVV